LRLMKIPLEVPPRMKVAGSGLGTVNASAIGGVRGICLRKIGMMKREH
jgi:hypothetical protein